MRQSESLNELATALAKAQGAIENASKSADNPYYKSKYSDLASVREAIRIPLAENLLSIIQLPTVSMETQTIEVDTMLIHGSGQFIAESLTLPAIRISYDRDSGEEQRTFDAQTVGSALTYARRYGLMAILNLAAEDDDGNAVASEPKKSGKAAPAKAAQKPTDNELAAAGFAADGGLESLRKWWQGLPLVDRDKFDPEPLKQRAIKADAAKVAGANPTTGELPAEALQPSNG